MNQEQLQQKIAEYFGKLPKEAQIVFSSMAWMETLKNIGAKYSLSAEQIETLGTETTLVLLSIIPIEEYQKIIETELGLTKEILEKIKTEIDENILKTIKNQLVETFESNAISLAEEKTIVDNKPLVLDPRFLNMPKNIQDAIALSDWKNKLYEISKKYKINIEQMGILEDLTVSVIQNKIHPDRYESEVISKISITKEDISNLIKDINDNILIKIRDFMKEGSGAENLDGVPIPPYVKEEKISVPYSSEILPNIQVESNKNEVLSSVITKEQPVVNNTERPSSVIKKEERLDQIEHITNKTETPIQTHDELKDAWAVRPTVAAPKIPTVDTHTISLGDKLKSITMSDHTMSDYSVPKISSPAISSPVASSDSLPKSHDPYREAF